MLLVLLLWASNYRSALAGCLLWENKHLVPTAMLVRLSSLFHVSHWLSSTDSQHKTPHAMRSHCWGTQSCKLILSSCNISHRVRKQFRRQSFRLDFWRREQLTKDVASAEWSRWQLVIRCHCFTIYSANGDSKYHNPHFAVKLQD